MKKSKKKDRANADYNAGIQNENIADACMDYMRIFGANNNLMRHLPEVFDGLKIGERRILYTMYKIGLSYDKPKMKVKSIVGDAMKLHPHGDIALEDTLVKLGQPWSNIQPFIDRQGNFGSPSGDSAASGRYIEARLSFYSYKCFFEEFSPNIVNMRDNYLGNDVEPEYLPAKYPNALINTSFGVGYGLSTSIPTYNFREGCEAAIDLIQNPDVDIVLVPDSPTGAYIVDEGQFPEISRTGRGKFKMRGVITIDDSDNSLIVTSTPLMVYWEKVKPNIIRLLNDGKNNLLKGIDDLSEGDNMRFKIILKKEADPVAVRHLIYSKTNMEKTFGVNFKMTENYTDNDYSIKSLLLTWIDFRRETKRRYYAHKLTAGKERQHILDILIMILSKDNAEQTVSIFKKSENVKECASSLMKTYGISSLQAKTIADMKFSALTKDAYKRYVKERKEIDKEVEEVEKIIRSAKKIDKIIIKELREGIELFGEDRRSEIINIDNEVKVRDTEHLVVFTRKGMVKKLPIDIGHIGSIASGDEVREVIRAKNTSDLMVFDSSGKVNKLPVHKLPNTSLNNDGFKLADYCNINGLVTTIKHALTTDDIEAIKYPLYYLMITKNGYIKKTSVEAFANIKNDLLAMVIKDGDSLVSCKILAGDKDILVYSSSGVGVRFNSADITETGRMSVGNISMPLDEGETVIGMDILNVKDNYIFVVTEKGCVKKCPLETFDAKGRNSKPIRLVRVDDRDNINMICTVRGDEVFRAYTKSGTSIDLDVRDINTMSRMSKGTRINTMKKSDTILRVKPI